MYSIAHYMGLYVYSKLNIQYNALKHVELCRDAFKFQDMIAYTCQKF